MGRLLSVFAAVESGRGHGRPCGGGDLQDDRNDKVRRPDAACHHVGNGSTYKVARGVNIKGTKAGQKVTVTTSGFGGTIEASVIAPSVD